MNTAYVPTVCWSRRQRIAVELNEEILPKANYAATVLKDGDVVEIVNFVGGGC